MDFMKENVGGAAAAPGMDAAIDRAARMTACRHATDNAPATLADLSMVGWLHGEFERECHVDDPVERRRMFVFIFALLYAPAALAGRRLPHGMRQALSSAVPDVAPCRLSCHLPEAAWEFAHYRTFRDEAARLAGVLGARACGRAR